VSTPQRNVNGEPQAQGARRLVLFAHGKQES
jgi:hypothetical protein